MRLQQPELPRISTALLPAITLPAHLSPAHHRRHVRPSWSKGEKRRDLRAGACVMVLPIPARFARREPSVTWKAKARCMRMQAEVPTSLWGEIDTAGKQCIAAPDAAQGSSARHSSRKPAASCAPRLTRPAPLAKAPPGATGRFPVARVPQRQLRRAFRPPGLPSTSSNDGPSERRRNASSRDTALLAPCASMHFALVPQPTSESM